MRRRKNTSTRRRRSNGRVTASWPTACKSDCTVAPVFGERRFWGAGAPGVAAREA